MVSYRIRVEIDSENLEICIELTALCNFYLPLKAIT